MTKWHYRVTQLVGEDVKLHRGLIPDEEVTFNLSSGPIVIQLPISYGQQGQINLMARRFFCAQGYKCNGSILTDDAVIDVISDGETVKVTYHAKD